MSRLSRLLLDGVIAAFLAFVNVALYRAAHADPEPDPRDGEPDPLVHAETCI